MKTHHVAVALVLAGCSEPGQPPAPDTALPGGDLTIEIHRQFPFVDGNTADDAAFVAVQDGDGPFVAASGQNGVYHVRVASDRYGIAVGCKDTSFGSIEIVQRVIADGTTYKTVCKSVPGTATLEVTTQNLPSGHQLRLRTATSFSQETFDGVTTLSLPPGPTELFGTVTDADRNVVKLIRKSIDVQNRTAITIDVATDGAAPETGAFTVSPAEPTATVRTSVVRASGTISLQAFGIPASTERYLMMPAALRQPDDRYRITVSGDNRTATHVVSSAQPLAFTLPSPLDAQPTTLVKTPFLHPVWTFTPTPSALPNQSYQVEVFDFFDPNVVVSRIWFATLSSAWIAGAPNIRYEFPDLSSMPGFADLALRERVRLDATIFRFESTGGSVGDESATARVENTLGEFCGDGVVQAAAGETCDPGEAGETETCDVDCTAAACGDGVLNFAANEECNPPDGATCSATCTNL